jgi:hypothetical protein
MREKHKKTVKTGGPRPRFEHGTSQIQSINADYLAVTFSGMGLIYSNHDIQCYVMSVFYEILACYKTVTTHLTESTHPTFLQENAGVILQNWS